MSKIKQTNQADVINQAEAIISEEIINKDMAKKEFDANVLANYKIIAKLSADKIFNKNKTTLLELSDAVECYVIYKMISNDKQVLNEYIQSACKNLKTRIIVLDTCNKIQLQLVSEHLKIAITAKREFNRASLFNKLKHARDLNNQDLTIELELKYNKLLCKDINNVVQTTHDGYFTDASIKQATNLNKCINKYLSV